MPWRPLSFKRALTWRIAGPLAAALALLLIVTSEAGYRATEQVTAQREAVIDARLAVGRLRHDVLGMESALVFTFRCHASSVPSGQALI